MSLDISEKTETRLVTKAQEQGLWAFTRVQPLASSPAREEKFTKVGGFLAPHRRHTTRRTARSTAGAGLRLQAGSRAGSGRMHTAHAHRL